MEKSVKTSKQLSIKLNASSKTTNVAKATRTNCMEARARRSGAAQILPLLSRTDSRSKLHMGQPANLDNRGSRT